MLFKTIHHHFKTESATGKNIDLISLFSRFRESKPIVLSNAKLSDNDRITDVLNWAKSQGYLNDLGLSDENAETLIRSFLVEQDLPEQLIQNENLRNELAQVIIKRAAESSPVRPEEAKQGLELISTGALFGDVSYSIAVIIAFITNSKRFSNPEENLKGIIEGLVTLPSSIASDLNPREFAERFSQQLIQIQSGKPLDNPEILDNTLSGIYALPEVGDAIDTASALLDEDNESLRLALLLYARLNGINLEQQDIDMVKATVLNRENPDLGSLLLYLGKDENLSRLIL